MNFSAITLDKFNCIEPQVVANYLRDSNWHEFESVDNHHAIWKLKHSNQTEYSLLLPLNPEIPDFPNRMYDVVHTLAAIEKRSEAELFNDLDSAARIAQEQRREILNLHLHFSKESRQPEAPAKKLGQLLAALQDTLDAIGQVEGGEASPIGRISENILERTRLDILSTFKGSFGIRLAVAPPEQLDLMEAPLAETVMADFIALLKSSKNDQELRDLIAKFQQRAAVRYNRFLLTLTEIEAKLRIEWGSQNPSKGGTAELSLLDALNAIEICDEVETAPPEELNIIGKLTAVNSEQKTFRIRDNQDGTAYFGKISDEVFESGISLVVAKPPKTYKALIKQTLEEKTTGESLIKNELIYLESIDAQKQKTKSDQKINSPISVTVTTEPSEIPARQNSSHLAKNPRTKP